MKAIETGTGLGLVALLIGLYLLGTRGKGIAEAAVGFAQAGATVIGSLQGNSVGAVGGFA